jgi:FtsP/CotA-like multicopper oxidase with cupredoxin domain
MTRFAVASTFVLGVLSLPACQSAESAPPARERVYYIAADEVTWDYAPSGINRITGKPFGDAEAFWVAAGRHKMGKVYKKAVYREYTDESFTALKPRHADWEHLGILGPIIRAEVGDTIRVIFKNNASFPASVHPHGVFYDKNSEGAPYGDGTSGADKADDGVPTGKTHTYTWQVSEPVRDLAIRAPFSGCITRTWPR